MTRPETFKHICNKMIATHEAKNSDYGDSFVKVRELYPDAIMIRLHDKVNRLESITKSGTVKVKTESKKDTLLDLANYCVMELVEIELEERETSVMPTADELNAEQELRTKVENMRIEEFCPGRCCEDCPLDRYDMSCTRWCMRNPTQAMEIMRKAAE